MRIAASRRKKVDGVGDVVPPRTGRGYEDEEGTAAVPFPQRAQPDDDQDDDAMFANSRPWSVLSFLKNSEEILVEETKEKREKGGERWRLEIGEGLGLLGGGEGGDLEGRSRAGRDRWVRCLLRCLLPAFGVEVR